MTCIIGIVDNKTKKVFIGADSAGVAGWHITARKDKKVFKVGKFIIGCTSSFRMIQLLQFSFNPPELKPDEDIFKYMCTSFIDEVRETFKKGGYIKAENERQSGGVFLVGYEDRLFYVDCDFQIAESRQGFDACGCGAEFALGALHQLNGTVMPPASKLKRSLETASYFSAGVCKPFNILNT